jgi:hypothetical protein
LVAAWQAGAQVHRGVLASALRALVVAKELAAALEQRQAAALEQR